MQQIPLVDLISQYKSIEDDIKQALEEVLSTAQFINGPAVRQFSASLSEYLDVKHVIPCANGTDALQIALMALDLQPGDEVITTPFTFVATAEVIALLKLKPVFVDVNPCTFVINEYLLEQAISPRTKCIIPVHLFGQTANMEAIMKIADKHGIAVVEDNAQAIGADFRFSDGREQKAGTIGTIGCTSFFPSKNLGCYGDGGALFTHDDELAAKIRMIANHGSEKRYYHDSIGVNSRLDSMQAAVLNVKLKRLDQYSDARRKAAHFYSEHLKGLPGVTVPKIANYSTHVFHQYTLLIEKGRDELQKFLIENGVSCAIYYPIPLHLQAAYQSYGYAEGNFPVSEELSDKVLSLPMHTELDEETLQRVVDTVVKGVNG
jgi:UDP-2-acetamido-2-deoxy-ribo-hexuluronate aminotransferase